MFTKREPSPELKALKQRVDEWRGSREKRTTIPEELWDEAVRVAQGLDGVWLTSQASHFNHTTLQTKVHEAGKPTPSRSRRQALAVRAKVAPVTGAPLTASRTVTGSNGRAQSGVATGVARDNGETPAAARAFIELPRPGTPSDGARTVIELVGRHGDRMRVEAAGGVDLVGMARMFWRGGET